MEKFETTPDGFEDEVDIIEEELKASLNEEKYGFDIVADRDGLYVLLLPYDLDITSEEIEKVHFMVANLLNLNEDLKMKAGVLKSDVGDISVYLQRK